MSWVAHDIRDELVDFVPHWSERTEICYEQLLGWIELSARKFRDWRVAYGHVAGHNSLVAPDLGVEEGGKKALFGCFHISPLEGEQRRCFLMLGQGMAR